VNGLQDQWQRKKQTKEEARAARRAKLDPDSEMHWNAKQVMDERAKKRKLEQMQEVEASEQENESENDEEDKDLEFDGPMEQPGEGLTRKENRPKMQESADTSAQDAEKSARKKAKEEKRLRKRQRKEEESRNKAKGERQAAADEKPVAETAPPAGAIDHSVIDEVPSAISSPSSDFGDGPPIFDAPPTPSNAVAGEAASIATSISSNPAPEKEQLRKHIKIPADSTALRARLAAKIEALRAARNADKNGNNIRTRQELIEARREKQSERKAHKKELRRQAKEEEDRKREEALASARNSPGGLLSPAAIELDERTANNNFAFGRMEFADGLAISHDLSYSKDSAGKKRGLSDPKSALAKLTAQKNRIAGLDADKRKEVLEKETWLAARRRAEGDKIHDDSSLLKKAIKRKEKAKRKSETDWKNRTTGIEKSIKERQKKREANIQQRKDQKFLGKAGKKKGGKPPPKNRNRAGFEGKFGSGRK
jgi:hypothetical protein